MLNTAHKSLEVYRIALELVREIYILTRRFPKEELYSLTLQLRRASISICSNLAEGSARFSRVEKKRFYEISRSSLVEVDTQLEISFLLGYIDKQELTKVEICLDSIFRMLSKMIKNLSI